MNEQQPSNSGANSSREPRGGIGLLLIGGVVLGSLMALSVIFFGAERRANLGPSPIPDLVQPGKPAPEFSALTASGQTITLQDYRGSVVAINFWATWCVPCRSEMPALEEAFQQGKLIVLGVNAGESAETITVFMEELDLTFPALLDPNGDIIDLYGVRVFPTTVLVDRDGIVIAEHLGALTPNFIDDYLAELSRN